MRFVISTSEVNTAARCNTGTRITHLVDTAGILVWPLTEVNAYDGRYAPGYYSPYLSRASAEERIKWTSQRDATRIQLLPYFRCARYSIRNHLWTVNNSWFLAPAHTHKQIFPARGREKLRTLEKRRASTLFNCSPARHFQVLAYAKLNATSGNVIFRKAGNYVQRTLNWCRENAGMMKNSARFPIS